MARVIKNKKIALKKPLLRSKQSARAKAGLKTEPRKENFGAQEIAVGTAKFSHPEVCRMPKVFSQELPPQYGVDKMVLMVRDPWWLYS